MDALDKNLYWDEIWVQQPLQNFRPSKRGMSVQISVICTDLQMVSLILQTKCTNTVTVSIVPPVQKFGSISVEWSAKGSIRLWLFQFLQEFSLIS